MNNQNLNNRSSFIEKDKNVVYIVLISLEKCIQDEN